MATNFPKSIDSFKEVFDLSPSMIDKAKRLKELKSMASLTSTESQELNDLTIQLSKYTISTDDWNRLTSATVAMQNVILNNGVSSSGEVNVDLTQYATNSSVDSKISDAVNSKVEISSFNTHVNNSNIHVSTGEKAQWNNKYDKPNNGIPLTDLEQYVQDKINNSGNSIEDSNKYEKPENGIPLADLEQDVQDKINETSKIEELQQKYDKPKTGIPLTDLEQSLQDKINTIGIVTEGSTTGNIDTSQFAKVEELEQKYEKPETGIPETDLEQDVQDKLDKANTALQSVSKEDIGLGNVDNTSDMDKPVSNATQIALKGKANAIHSHNISDITNLQTTLSEKASTDVVTKYKNGLMDYNDKNKLDGIEENSNNYIHPKTHPATMIEEDNEHKFVTSDEKDVWNSKETITGSQVKATEALNNAKSYTDNKVANLVGSAPDALNTLEELATAIQDNEDAYDGLLTTIGGKASKDIATTTSNGLMSFEDKVKLDNVEENANNYIHPTSHPATMIVEDSTHKFVTNAKISEWDSKETTTGAQTKATQALNSAKSYTDTKVADLIDSAPEAMNTLNELATAIQNNENSYDGLLQVVGEKATKIDLNSKIDKSEKGVAGGVATLNSEGKVVDSNGNEVSGKVTSVNGLIGDVVIEKDVVVQDVKPDGIVEGRIWIDTSDDEEQGTVFEEIKTDITNLQTALQNVKTTSDSITITDSGNYFESTNVEGALQEIGRVIGFSNSKLRVLANSMFDA